jgi:hypothetical protein
MKIDISKINAELKSRKKESFAPLPKEFKELAKSKARLQAKVSQLEREVRKQLGARPAVAKPAPAKKRIIQNSAEEQARLERLYIEQERKKER